MRIPRPNTKLFIDLLPVSTSPVQTDGNTSVVVSSRILTIGRTSKFYIQLIPSKPIERYEPLPMSYVLLTNGRITLTGQFTVQPIKECQSKSKRSIKLEEEKEEKLRTCILNGTLSIQITRAMTPYSTLLVYTFQPSFDINVIQSYRFSVANLFRDTLKLNATIVPFTLSSTMNDEEAVDSVEDLDSSSGQDDLQSIPISNRAQSKTYIELSFTGAPYSIVALNVIQYKSILQGLSNEITKERLLHYLTTYEQIPIVGMSTSKIERDEQFDLDVHKADTEDETKEHDSTSAIEWDDDDDRISDNHIEIENKNSTILFHDMIDEGEMDEASNETKSKEETMNINDELDFEILTEEESAGDKEKEVDHIRHQSMASYICILINFA